MVALGQITNDQNDLESAERHVLEVVRRAGTSFYWAMRFLPAEKRDAIFAVYAFCREVDDIADEEGAIEDKRLGLAKWRDEIDHISFQDLYFSFHGKS